MEKLITAVNNILDWHANHFEDDVVRENAFADLRNAYKASQQSMHWIGGEAAPLQAESTPEVLSTQQADTTPAPIH